MKFLFNKQLHYTRMASELSRERLWMEAAGLLSWGDGRTHETAARRKRGEDPQLYPPGVVPTSCAIRGPHCDGGLAVSIAGSRPEGKISTSGRVR